MAQVDYFQRKLDDKRRLTIPTELRNEFASGVVVTRGFQKYLHVYPKHVWDDEVEARLKGDILDERIADLNVQFRMGKIAGDMDTKQGRITLEQHLWTTRASTKACRACGLGSIGGLWQTDGICDGLQAP